MTPTATVYRRNGARISEGDLPKSEFLIMKETGIPWGASLAVLGLGKGYLPGTTHFKIPGSCSVCELIVKRE